MTYKPQLKITTDGQAQHTQIELDGKPWNSVRSLVLTIDPEKDGFCTAALVVEDVALDLNAFVVSEKTLTLGGEHTEPCEPCDEFDRRPA